MGYEIRIRTKLRISYIRRHSYLVAKMMPKKQLEGIVISNKMQKTVVVKVERLKEHPKYKRRFRVHKNYKAHVEKGEYQIGDKVIIEECRPISKEKRWRVIKKL